MPITISYKKFNLIPITVTWFNNEPTFEFDTHSLFHIFRQSKITLYTNITRCVKEYKSTTSIIDLIQSEEQLWKNLAPKSCRYEIRKVLKMLDAGKNVLVKEKDDLKQFLKLANRYIREKGYSNPLTIDHFTRFLKRDCGELLTVYHDNRLLGGNFYIKDYPSRVRLLYSFNNRFEDEKLQKLSGAFMRYLHWHAMTKKYRKQGFQGYDMGGVDLNPNSETYGISKFKLSFGGDVFEEFNYVFVRSKIISNTYKMYQKLIKR